MTALSLKKVKFEKIKEKRKLLDLPFYTTGEEIFSAVVHGVAALSAVAALVLLLVFCEKNPLTIASSAVFGGTMVLLYTVSTLYHALGINKAKKVFRILDHCTIFFLIAGTYTPITLLGIGGTKGLIMFLVVWVSAVVGVVLNSINLKRFAKVSMVCYLAMGWVIVFAIKDFFTMSGIMPLIFLGIGGIFYTVGAVLYGIGKKKAYIHSVWHIFVFIGSAFHFVTVWNIAV